MFHNLIRRNAKPSLDTLEEIAANYDDFDLNYIVRGKRTIEHDTWYRVQKENEELRRERNIFLGAMEKLGKYKAVTIQPVKVDLYRRGNPKRRSHFGSQPTAY